MVQTLHKAFLLDTSAWLQLCIYVLISTKSSAKWSLDMHPVDAVGPAYGCKLNELFCGQLCVINWHAAIHTTAGGQNKQNNFKLKHRS